MNLIEESFQKKEEVKNKKTTKFLLAAIIMVVIIIIAIVAYLMYLESSKLTFLLDGQLNENIKSIVRIEEDGSVYFPIKEVAKYLSYNSYNGDYTDKSEDISKCYVQSQNEVANFVANSNYIYKLDLNNNNYEYIYLQEPIKSIDGVLYTSEEGLEKAFNVSFQYDQTQNKMYLITMPYLIQLYTTRALEYGYSEISDIFANQKAIMESMLIVKKDKYGIIDLEGNVILEPKYDNITYLPQIGDFLVQNNGKVGTMSKSGDTKVQINYDSIELMDKDAGLYLVRKDGKYGVLDLNGNIKIHIEYDEIGIDISKFKENNIKNKYLLGDNLIPVRQDKLWGLYDKNGNRITEFKYDSFGYVASSNRNARNLLVIPDYNVLVACKDKKYTLLNQSGEELFNIIADDIYMTIVGGEKDYHIIVNGKDLDAIGYLESRETNNQENNNVQREEEEIENENEQQEEQGQE